MKDKLLQALFVVLIIVWIIDARSERPNASLPFSLVALYIAIYTFRSNTKPIIHVRNCKSSARTSAYENNWELFSELELVIENRGVKLVQPFVKINFAEADGHGSISFPLEEFIKIHGKHESLERGMIAVYGLKTYKLTSSEKQSLNLLKNPGEQTASFCIYSQSYLAYEIRIGGPLDRLKSKWNAAAIPLNWRFRRSSVAKDGTEMLSTPQYLPTFTVYEDQVRQFISGMNEPDKSREKSS
jgi:hypothetical protein